MSENFNNFNIQNARKRGPLTAEQRERKQKRFLNAFRESGNIKHSCKVASIDRRTYYDWRDTDEGFKAQLPDAREDANDTLEYAAYERAVHGIDEPALSQGQLVYEYEHLVDETTGKLMFSDNGKPLMKRVKQVMIRKYSDTLLVRLLSANMPEKYREKQSIEHTGKGGGPIEYISEWGGGTIDDDDEQGNGA